MNSCGQNSENVATETIIIRQDEVTIKEKEIEELKTIIFALQGSIQFVEELGNSDFSGCSSDLDSFQRKICQIAQSSNSEQRVILVSQISEITKIFQNEMFGENCLNDVSPECPEVGSLVDRVNKIESFDLPSELAFLKLDIAVLQSMASELNSRFNNFDGSNESIEVVIRGLASQIVELDTRVDTIETELNEAEWWKTVQLCGDNKDSGPIYEVVLVNGSAEKVLAYGENRGSSGLTILKEIGTDDGYFQTNLNSRSCNYVIYDRSDALTICWNNIDRKASQNEINTVCDVDGGFANRSQECTCTEYY